MRAEILPIRCGDRYNLGRVGRGIHSASEMGISESFR